MKIESTAKKMISIFAIFRLVLEVDLYYRSTSIILDSDFPRLLMQVDLY